MVLYFRKFQINNQAGTCRYQVADSRNKDSAFITIEDDS